MNQAELDLNEAKGRLDKALDDYNRAIAANKGLEGDGDAEQDAAGVEFEEAEAAVIAAQNAYDNQAGI